MTVSFELPELGKATGNGLNQESLGLLGVEMASENLPDDHMFSRMGGWNVTFRASIVRIAFFKLLGIGLVAAFMATSPHVGAFTAWSLTMSAAINLVACAHYYWICECFRFKPLIVHALLHPVRPFSPISVSILPAGNVRAQTYRLPTYDKWMAKIPRASAENKKLFEAQQEHDKRAIYFQEVTTDGLRYAASKITPRVPFCSHAPVRSRLQLQRLARDAR